MQGSYYICCRQWRSTIICRLLGGEWESGAPAHYYAVSFFHLLFPFMGINLTIFGIKFHSVLAAPPSQSQSPSALLLLLLVGVEWRGGGGVAWRDRVYTQPVIYVCVCSQIDCRGSACIRGFPAHAKSSPPTRKPHSSWIPFLSVNSLPF